MRLHTNYSLVLMMDELCNNLIKSFVTSTSKKFNIVLPSNYNTRGYIVIRTPTTKTTTKLIASYELSAERMRLDEVPEVECVGLGEEVLVATLPGTVEEGLAMWP
jgi:hypothetical protein